MIIRLFLLILIILGTLTVLYFNKIINFKTGNKEIDYLVEPTVFPPDLEEQLAEFDEMVEIAEESVDQNNTEDDFEELAEELNKLFEESPEKEKNFLEKEWPRILEVGMIGLELFQAFGDVKELRAKFKSNKALGSSDEIAGQVDEIKHLRKKTAKSLKKITDKLSPQNLKKTIKSLASKSADMTKTLKKSFSKAFSRAYKGPTKKAGRLANSLTALGPVGADVSKSLKKIKPGQLAKSLSNVTEGIGAGVNTALDSIKSSTKAASRAASKSGSMVGDTIASLGKAVPFLGLAFAVGGGAFCFCDANSVGSLENEYKDDKNAVAESNVACGIEMALDLLLEATELFATIGAMACLGPIGAVIGAIIMIFQLISAIFDMFDACGYERPMYDNKQLEELRNQTLYGYMNGIQEAIEEAKDDIYDEFIKEVVKVTNEMIDMMNEDKPDNEKSKSMTKEDFESFMEDEERQLKAMGTTLYDMLGYDLKTFISKTIDENVRTLKYPKPVEFNRSGDGFEYNMNETDLEKFNLYQAEYYSTCGLIPNLITPEYLYKNYIYRQQRLKGYLNINIKMAEAQAYAKATQEGQLSALDKIKDFTLDFEDLATNIIDEIDNQRVFIKKYYKKRFTNNEEYRANIEHFYSNSIFNTLNNISIISNNNPEIGFDKIFENLNLQDEQDEIMKEIADTRGKAKEARKYLINNLIITYKLRENYKKINSKNAITLSNIQNYSMIILVIIIVSYIGYESFNLLSDDYEEIYY